MTDFLIFYFVFSAMFIFGVRSYEEKDIPLKDAAAIVLLGWALLPFALGMAIGKFFNTKENE